MSTSKDLATLEYRRQSLVPQQAHKPEGPQGEVIALPAPLRLYGDASGRRTAELLG